MNFAAVHHAQLCQGALVSASDRALGAWTRVLVYASYIEKAKIPAKLWKDREWRATANVSKRGVDRAVAEGLLAWEGDDLVVKGFDHHGLVKVEQKRANGRFGYLGAAHGIKGGRPRKDGKKKPPLMDPNLTFPYPHDPDPESAREEDQDPDQSPEAWTNPDLDPDFDYEAGTTKAMARAQEQRLAARTPLREENARQRAGDAAESASGDDPMTGTEPPETSTLTARQQAIANAEHRLGKAREGVFDGSSETGSVAASRPLTGHRLLQIFQKVRADMDEKIFPWTIPSVMHEKAARMAEAIVENGAVADVEPTVRLFYEKAAGKKIRKAEEILRTPAFAFGVWCVEFDGLRAELRQGPAAGGRKSIYQDL